MKWILIVMASSVFLVDGTSRQRVYVFDSKEKLEAFIRGEGEDKPGSMWRENLDLSTARIFKAEELKTKLKKKTETTTREVTDGIEILP